MNCPKCGKVIANDSVYCEYCGAKVAQTPPKQSSELKDKLNDKYFITLLIVALVNLTNLCVAYSVHWETFAYYGIDYEGYPGAGEYNGWFFMSVFLWVITLVALPYCINLYRRKKQ